MRSRATIVVAVPSRELHFGAYSVHTSADAPAAGERNLRELKKRLDATGDRGAAFGSTPGVRHPHTPGPISSLLGTAGLPPSISFSTNYLELSRRNAHDAELPEADHSSD